MGAVQTPAGPHVTNARPWVFVKANADAVDDLEDTRKRINNQLKSLRDVKGMGGSRQYEQLQELADQVATLEAKAIGLLEVAVRQCPLGPWVKRIVGLGDKQAGRLLATIGDPYWKHTEDIAGNVLDDRPRTVGELWALCGYHVLRPGHLPLDAHFVRAGAEPCDTSDHFALDTQPRNVVGVAPRRMRGQKSNWNNEARKCAHNCAEKTIFFTGDAYEIKKGPCAGQMRIRRRSPYRTLYEEERRKYEGAIHNFPCPQCGPAGHPAQIGSLVSDSHNHARGIRRVAKEILKDMWIESRRLHDEGELTA